MSSYLKSCSDGLVDWHDWGFKSFKKAKREGKPIFLSIGYSTSEMCNIMRNESYNKNTIADFINRNFIPIKVDKDERPDIDKYYKNVYRLMNGERCSSPISLFLTESREPFYSASYIAPFPKGNVLGFQELLNIVVEKYNNDKKTMREKGKEVLNYLHRTENRIEATVLNKSVIKTVVKQIMELWDRENGGFGDVPKFPHTSTIDLVLDSYLLTGKKELLTVALFTLKKMVKGEIFDKRGEFYYRFAREKDWRNPRRENMLYDNANLSSLYIRAYEITGEGFYKEVALKVINSILKNRQNGELLFYSNSLHGEDGLTLFQDKKIILSWNAMMIETLFKVSTIEKGYLNIAVQSMEKLLNNFYINGKLYHTKEHEGFLEDYAYIGYALLVAYKVTKDEEYLVYSQTILNKAIERFYDYGRWRYADNGEFQLYDDIYDIIYPSSISTILHLMEEINPLVEADYSQMIFKTLEINSYNLMRQPLSSPKMAKLLLLHLKDDIIRFQ